VFTYVYSGYALCLLLQILLVAALDIKARDVPTVSSINSLLSQYCKTSLFFFFCKFLCFLGGGGRRQLFALPQLSHGERPALLAYTEGWQSTLKVTAIQFYVFITSVGDLRYDFQISWGIVS
jgi:hypothetical protein